MTYKILLVDDEVDILEFMEYNLLRDGFEVRKAENGEQAIAVAKEFRPHLILLDVMMPVMDGIETCERIRATPEIKDTIVAFLTARGEDYSQIAGFDAGGDDYITKPIRPKVLISRLRALLKRLEINYSVTESAPVEELQQDVVIDRERYLVVVKGVEIVLPRKEFELLSLLHSRANKVLSREEIFDTVWGNDVVVGDRTIDVHIRKLREKIGEEYITTVKGVGYKFNIL